MNRQCIVEIKKYSKKGLGQGISEEFEKPIVIRGTHPGEQCLVEIFKKKQGVHEGKLLKLLKEHSERVLPKCSHAGICGGCLYQDLNYEQQILHKEHTLKELFKDILLEENIVLPSMITMENPWQFRNKMEFSFHQDKEKRRYLGLIIGGSKGKVVNLEECHVVRPWMAAILKQVREWWETTSLEAYHPFSGQGTLYTLTLREGMHTGEKLIMLTVTGSPSSAFSHRELESFKKAVLHSLEGVVSLFLQIKQAQQGQPTQFHEMLLHGPDHIHEKLTINYPEGKERTFTFKISPSSFFQPNTSQAEKLFSRALAMITPKEDLKILDLYCGTAALGMIFSCFAKKVVGVELNPYAVFDAQVNLEENHISNVEVFQGDVKNLLNMTSLREIDLMIVDPPRAGIGSKTLQEVLSLFPKEILYISCNPYTQLEDIKECIAKGYRVKALQPVDQFPHTPHVENIAILQRKI
jgi:23S rRNA (uracil1939-C5)-methyltransferase